MGVMSSSQSPRFERYVDFLEATLPKWQLNHEQLWFYKSLPTYDADVKVKDISASGEINSFDIDMFVPQNMYLSEEDQRLEYLAWLDEQRKMLDSKSSDLKTRLVISTGPYPTAFCDLFALPLEVEYSYLKASSWKWDVRGSPPLHAEQPAFLDLGQGQVAKIVEGGNGCPGFWDDVTFSEFYQVDRLGHELIAMPYSLDDATIRCGENIHVQTCDSSIWRYRAV